MKEPLGASVLFVSGGQNVMESVYRERRIGYWSAAFGVILEKRGWLDFDTASPDVLDEPDALRRHDLVIVAWLPDWKTSWLRSLRAYDGAILLEGPLPPLLESFAGLKRVEGEPGWTRGVLRVRHRLRRSLTEIGVQLDGDGLTLAQAAEGSAGAALPDDREAQASLLADLAASYARLYADRLKRDDTIFPHDPRNDGLAVLALALYLAKLPPSAERDALGALKAKLFPPAEIAPTVMRGAGKRSEESETCYCAARIVIGRIDPNSGSQPGRRFPRRSSRPLRGAHTARLLAAMRAYEAALASDQARAQRLAAAAALGGKPIGRDALRLWLLAGVREGLGSSAPHSGRETDQWLDELAGELEDSVGERLAEALVDWQVLELLPLAGVLRRRGRPRAADVVLRSVLRVCVDPETGRLLNGRVVSGAILPAPTRTLAPVILLGLLDAVPRTVPFRGHEPQTPGRSGHAGVLMGSPLRVEPFRNVGAEDELVFDTAAGPRAGVTRRGRVLSSSFPLLSHLVHSHAIGAGDVRAIDAGTAAFEEALFLLLEDQLARYGRTVLQVRASASDEESGRCPGWVRRPVIRPGGLVEAERVVGLDRQTAKASDRAHAAADPEHMRTARHPLTAAASAAEPTAWWSATDRRDVLRVRKLADERRYCGFELCSSHGVKDLELRFCWPIALIGTVEANGAEVETSLLGPPSEGISIRLSIPPGGTAALHIERSRLGRYAELASHLDAVGERPDIQFRPDELLPRVSNLTEIINHFTPFTDIMEAQIGDVGCGYGPFPLGLYLVERPRRVLGIDTNTASLRTAAALTEAFGASGAHFVEGDVNDLHAVRGLDVLLALNVLYYLTSGRAQRIAARSCFNALRPGGAVVALVTNRLHRIDAFTGLPNVHRLPRPLADYYVRLRGARHGYRDVRSPSPTEMLRAYRRAGFERVELIDPDQVARIDDPRSYHKPRFYVVALKARA